MGSENQDPSPFNCHGYFPGINGRALSPSGERIFLGGGGGAGHSNNIGTSEGVNGGAMVIIITDDVAGNNNSILNFGLNAPTSSGDGAGGGGAGGSVFIKSTSFSSPLTIDVHGGEGGDMDAAIAFNMDRCFGPGGGGAGGTVRYSENSIPANHTLIVNGGSAGIVMSSTNICNGTSVTATGGGNGGTQLNGILPRGFICNDDCASNMNVDLGPDLLLCDSPNTTLDAQNNGMNYLWSTGETTQTITVNANGDYGVEVDNNFCKDYDTVTVYNLTSPDYPETTVFGVCETSVTIDAGTPGIEYIWNTGDTTQTISVSLAGLYYVDMYFEHCGFRAFFHVYSCINPPNTITPNADGSNDQWFIEYILDYPDNRVEIYNRRGQLVYEKESYSNEFSGDGLPDGVYYYKIDLRNGLEIVTGSLTIIREN
jgi:gliding motility-associated-like protein